MLIGSRISFAITMLREKRVMPLNSVRAQFDYDQNQDIKLKHCSHYMSLIIPYTAQKRTHSDTNFRWLIMLLNLDRRKKKFRERLVRISSE